MIKNIVAAFLAVAILAFSFPCSIAEESTSTPYAPILQTWNATNGKELHLNILEYWKSRATRFTDRLNPRSLPLNIRLGGTTKELIADKKDWDLAIVSSKDVDLQLLADEGLIMGYGNSPWHEENLHQWLLPKNVQDKLPVDPILMYEVYCYDYSAETDDATFLICQENIGKKKNAPRSPGMFAQQILQRRSPEQVRALEGLCRANSWNLDGIAELSEEDLLLNADEWDFATIRIKSYDTLAALDQAGLLIDFGQDEYWRSRNAPWAEPNGIFSADGRMIAIPYAPFLSGDHEKDTISVIIGNKNNVDAAKITGFAKHFVKSFEWAYGCKENDTTPPEIQKYGICIYKDDVDW